MSHMLTAMWRVRNERLSLFCPQANKHASVRQNKHVHQKDQQLSNYLPRYEICCRT